MSSASANPLGGALPQPGPSRPAIVKPLPPKPRPRGLWWGLAAVAVIAAGGAYLNRDRLSPKQGGGGTASTAIRTAVVSVGDLQRTLRLGGSITAERFAAITAPRLMGNRGSMSGNRISSRGTNSTGAAVSYTALAVTSSNAANTVSSSTTLRNSSANRFGGSSARSGASSGSSAASSSAATPAATSGSSGSSSGGSSSSGGGSSSGGSGGGRSRGGSGGGGSGGSSGGGGGVSMSGDFALVLLELPNPGGHVKAGEMVAAFDRESMLNRIDDYKDAVTQAELNIKNRKASLAVASEAHQQKVRAAKADMEKAQLDLKTLEVVSDIDAERLKLAAEETAARYKQLLREVPLLAVSQKAELRNTEISLETSKIELQKANLNAEKMVLKAPMAGLVVMQTMRRGMEFGQVAKGDQIFPGQMFMQIVDPSSMVVNASVNQVDAELLRIGMKATVRLDAYPGLELPAHVYSIGAVPVAGRRPNFMRQLPIRLKLDKVDARVLPDLSASAEIILESQREATMTPSAAIFGGGAEGKPFVFLRSPDGWQKREIELGVRSNVAVAVRSGLNKGDVVALDNPQEAGPAGANKPPS